MSSEMGQLSEYPIEKSADFHPDFALAVCAKNSRFLVQRTDEAR
jgi:hypothetical protein